MKVKTYRFISCLFFVAVIGGPIIAPQTSAQQKKGQENFMWTGADNLLESDPRMLDNILAFAERHEIIPYESGIANPEELKAFLRLCKKHNIDSTWIEIGPREGNTGDATVKEFVTNKEKRKATLDRFRRLARTYQQIYPEFARITIFDEAPLGAFAHGKEGYKANFETFRKYAPRAFSYMYQAIKSVMPKAEVGIFLHHPHNASPQMASSYTYIEQFMRSADSLKSTPDFIFSDVYRGYFNRGYGVEATNRYITDVVDYTGRVADKYGADHFQLGQVHTIKLGYTPSRRQIDTNIEAMLQGDPDGIGWYWPNYASTNYRKIDENQPPQPEGYDVSFDPFVPNAWGKRGPAGSLYGTSRDRFTYSYLSVQESVEKLQPDQRFDLWIYGHDFDHTEHALYLKEKEKGNWRFIGYFNPQQDRDAYIAAAREKYIYSYNDKWHAVVFHGLHRAKFIDGEKVQIKITTPNGSDESQISGIYLMPYRATRHYATEPKVTRWIESHPRWMQINSLANHVRPTSFNLKEDTTFKEVLKIIPGTTP